MTQTFQAGVNALSSVDWYKAKLQFEIGPVEVDELTREKSSLCVIDVRDKDSYEKEHVPGAINIPLKEFPKRMAEIPRDKTIVTYCWSVTCHLATKAALDLAHRDFKVQEMVGGIKEWKANGLPLEGSEARQTPRA